MRVLESFFQRIAIVVLRSMRKIIYIQVLYRLDFKSVWKKVDELDSGIDSVVSYAYDMELGFLTACPTNLGTE